MTEFPGRPEMAELGARLPDPRMIPHWTLPARRRDDAPPETTLTEPVPADTDHTVVRPFLVTGGRTQPLHDGLRLHTMLSAPPAALHAPLRFELREIVELCQRPSSVADVATGLRIPLGVARVLIADLVNGHYVSCHDQDEEELTVDVIERIRDRVRAL